MDVGSILAEFEKLATWFFAFNPHVLVCTLRLKASKRLALFQIELRIPTLHLLEVYLGHSCKSGNDLGLWYDTDSAG